VRTLHILDHSLPLHSGYTFRTVAILREQRASVGKRSSSPRRGMVRRKATSKTSTGGVSIARRSIATPA
jgi:hypothetical protein